MTKKSIVLINMNAPYSLGAPTLMLASPGRTSTIHQLLVYDDNLKLKDLVAHKGNDDNDDEHVPYPLEASSFDTIFSHAHTVIVPDGLLCHDSKVFKTDAFLNHGIESLVRFYNKGGNVIVVCIEGVFSVGTELDKHFGTDWKFKFFEATTVEPTERGRALFGTFTPKSVHLKGIPYFLSCPDNEGLYQKRMDNKDEFTKHFHEEDETFEKLGIEKDESMDCFNVEKSWDNYIRRYSNSYCICLHEGDGGGKVVWYGDRGESDSMSFVFCKILNFGGEQIRIKDDSRSYHKPKTILLKEQPIATWQLAAAVLVVVLAVLMSQLFVR
jgi:hypothetical protein